jgi:transcriptional repressor NrdR
VRCPFCAAPDTRVVDSRLVEEGGRVRRRRECPHCNARFSTYEQPELSFPRIVKRSGAREAFDPGKLRAGMERALEKRPVSTEQVDAVVARLTRRLHTLGERECSAETLGGWVMDELRALDQVAYVRFASVYRSFTDVREFRAEVERLERGEADAPARAEE